jgi:hypothetical protein
MTSSADPAPRKPRRYAGLCFERAFPGSAADHRLAVSQLDSSGAWDEPVYYRFSFDVARWLARRAPNAVSIDWAELHDTEALDNLLRLILQPAEDEYFDSGEVSTQEWMDIARAGFDGTDFDWLMAQLCDKRFESFYRELYDAADVPLAWELGDSSYAKSRNVIRGGKVVLRAAGMRRRPRQAKKEIARSVEGIVRLPGKRGAQLLDVAIASLAARHRETYHFNFANPEEVYLADVGLGIQVAVFGLLPEYRFPLECTMGYLVLSNGVPIGYGGSSALFKQVNTGINIFDEYRNSEAAFLWVQVMRVYHSLVGCTRFIANPYQLGSGNREALRSGAFWFYYRLGYRPVDRSIRDLARKEDKKIQHKAGYRSDLRKLTRLSSCDMHLTLPAAKQNELFDETWLSTSSGLATQVLGSAKGRSRQASANRVARELAENLGVRSLQHWSQDERRGLLALAPFLAAVDPSGWSKSQKRAARRLLRAKGSKRELDYANLMATNDEFLQSLRTACRQASRQ